MVASGSQYAAKMYVPGCSTYRYGTLVASLLRIVHRMEMIFAQMHTNSYE